MIDLGLKYFPISKALNSLNDRYTQDMAGFIMSAAESMPIIPYEIWTIAQDGYEAAKLVSGETSELAIFRLAQCATISSRLHVQGMLSVEIALNWNKLAYETTIALYGLKHTSTLSTLRSYSTFCCDVNERSEGIRLAKLAYEIACEILDKDHPGTMDLLNSLAYNLSEDKQYDEALVYARECVERSIATLGESKTVTLYAMTTLAETLVKIEGNDNAGPKEALEVLHRCRNLAASQRDIRLKMIIMEDMAQAHRALGQYDIAIALLMEAVSNRIAYSGEQHQETIECQGLLAQYQAEVMSLKNI
jgi:tetratricopeptide (TPR) repeat protein